jgi:inosine-uridine nucleoside N-ribohydrolase
VRWPLAISFVLGGAVLVAPAAEPAPAKQSYDIDHAADVERTLAETLGPRRPPIDLPAITTAWQAIVADTTRPPIKIIFDTDIGTDIDDAIALSFALRRPEVKVCAITTSRGEVQQRAAIVSRLLQVLRRTEVPFAPGSPKLIDGRTLRDKPVDQFPFAGPENDRPRAACADAQELFRRVIEANRGEVWLVVVGPMTNAAILIRDHPEVARELKGIVCMGGEPLRGSVETNIGNDPAAAALVCRSGLLKFAGTDDVTRWLLLPRPDIERLRNTDTPLARSLVELHRLWRIQQNTKPGPVVFDVNPVIWLFAPELYTTVSHGLAVDAKGLMTVADAAPPCALSTGMNVVAVHRLLMDTLTF